MNQQTDTPLRSLQTEQANLHRLISDISVKLDNLCSRNNSLRNQINDTSELINSAPTSVESPTTTALSIADELADRERRKCNVIVYNLSESNNLSNDKAQFVELCKSAFDITIGITKVIRLGRKTDNKSRPLLVSMEDAAHIANILSRAPSLRRHAQYKNIYIAPDMTKFQREKRRKLVDELRSRKANGETNLIISNGVIVTRKPRNQNASSTDSHSASPPVSSMSS